jgi:hypothetical protein
MKILEKQALSLKSDPAEPYPILDYVDNIFKEKKVLDQEFFSNTADYKYPEMPPYLKKSSPKTDSDSDQSLLDKYIKNKKYILLKDESERFISICELIKNHSSSSPDNTNATKLITFCFGPEKVRKYLAKCKSEGLKLTGALNMLLILAFKVLSNKYNAELDRVYFMNSISLRQFLPEEIRSKAATFSYMANAMPIYFDLDQAEPNNSIEYYLENFWRLAKLESNTLHQKIANNQQFIRWDWAKVNRTDNQMLFYFFLSNIGAYTWPSNDSSSLFDFKDSYMTLNLKKMDNAKFELEANTVSINDTLYWSFLYHLSANDYTIMDELKQTLIWLSDKVEEAL